MGFRTALRKATVAAAAVGLSMGSWACGDDENDPVGDTTTPATTTEPTPTTTQRTTPTTTTDRTTTTKTSTTAKKPPKKSNSKRCGPTPLDLDVPGDVTVTPSNEVLSVRLSPLRLGSGSAKIEMRGTTTLRQIASLQVRGKTFSAPNTKYVGVRVKITNAGKRLISPAVVGSAFRLRTRTKSFVLSDAVPNCAGLSTSFAGSQSLPPEVLGKLVPPQTGISPGAVRTTVFVFALPDTTKPQTLFSPRLKVAIRVRN